MQWKGNHMPVSYNKVSALKDLLAVSPPWCFNMLLPWKPLTSRSLAVTSCPTPPEAPATNTNDPGSYMYITQLIGWHS